MPGPVLSLTTALHAGAAVPVLLKQDLRLAGHSGLLKMTRQVVEVTVALLFFQKFFPAPSKLIAYCSVFSVGERSGIIFRNWQKPFEPHHLVKLSNIIGCTLFLSKKNEMSILGKDIIAFLSHRL